MAQKPQRSDYVVITPVRNEAENLPRLITSLAAQTIQPRKWVLVDDGSTDGTGALAEEARAKHAWIDVVQRSDRGYRKPGGGVVEAFYDGYRRVEEGWDFIVKLDGDLSFASDYFERLFERFAAEPKLGIGGGTICKPEGGGLTPEWKGDPRFHVRGATKTYRAECWRQLGGLHPAPGWDTLDEVKANMLGWKTRTFAELKLRHHRPAGEADGTWANWFKNGRANYVTGYLPLFVVCKCGARAFKPPYGIAALGLFCGYLSGYLKGLPRIDDAQLIRYLRRQQMRRLLFQSSLWS
jgi:poly-beta-1,6-N-acetyl-D-glucosamine synthase